MSGVCETTGLSLLRAASKSSVGMAFAIVSAISFGFDN